MKTINYPKGQEWWEVSRNPNPQQAASEEMQEIIEEARWWRKNPATYPAYCPSEGKGYPKDKDIQNFWKKWSEGGHFWHPQKKRWYSEKQ